MGSESKGRSTEPQRQNPSIGSSIGPDGASASSSASLGTLELVQKAFMAPFTHKKSDSTRILSDRMFILPFYHVYKPLSFTVAPVIMTPRLMNSASTISSKTRSEMGSSTHSTAGMSFSTLGHVPLRLGLGSKRITSGDLQIFEATEDLLHADVPEPEGVASNVSLLRGFKATIPSSEQGKIRRRQMRNVETPRLGLKKLGMSARGLLSDDDEHDEQSVPSEDDLVVIRQSHNRTKKKERESLSASKRLGKDELMRQRREILIDKENIHVRKVDHLPAHWFSGSRCKQSLTRSEIEEINNKIQALDNIRTKLEQDLLRLQEEELELDDERKQVYSILWTIYSSSRLSVEGVRERTKFEQTAERHPEPLVPNLHLPESSRRRKGTPNDCSKCELMLTTIRTSVSSFRA